MRSHGEPVLTSVKVVTALILSNTKADPKKAIIATSNILKGQVFYKLPKYTTRQY